MLTKISNGIKVFMPLIVLAVAALALFAPGTCLWVQTTWINPLLMVVLFGMGLTMDVNQFATVFRHPKDCLLGVVASVVLLNLLGYAFGYGIGKATGMTLPRRKALSLEVGMQNSGLATSLALTVFPGMALATVPGAVFSVWHNISGSILASAFRHMEKQEVA